MALNQLPGTKSFFDATMLTSVGQNPGDITQLKTPYVATQFVATQPHPLLPPPPPPPSGPPSHPPPDGYPHPPRSDSASGFEAGDIAERQLGPAQSLSGNLGGKVIADPSRGKNHVVWVVSDSHLNKQQLLAGATTSGRKKKLTGRPLFSPFKWMLTKDKRRSATEILINAPVGAASSELASAQPSSQSLDGQHLLHLVRTNDDLTQQLIAKSNAIFNLEARVAELASALDQMKVEIESGKARETEFAEEIRMLQETLANNERDADARNKQYEAEAERLTEQLTAMMTENETLRTELQTSIKKGTSVTEQNYNQERLIQELQSTIDELQDQLHILSTERDSFKKFFATAKLDAAQKREELREKIVDLLDKQRDITASIRKGLPLGRIALKKVLQKSEKYLDVKAQKQLLQQKVDFLSNKSFVQDMYIDDLRQVVSELARTLVDHQLTPGYSLSQTLDRLNMPFDEVVQMSSTPYRWETVDETSSDDSDASETATEVQSNDSDDSGSENPEESAEKWRKRKKKKKRARQKEELSSDVSGSENDAESRKGITTARDVRRLANKRT